MTFSFFNPEGKIDHTFLSHTIKNFSKWRFIIPFSHIHFMVTTPVIKLEEKHPHEQQAVGRDRYRELAMGGGQQQAALELLSAAATSGSWLCLKNLHLVVAWLPALEKALAGLNLHADFRLWLTTEPHPLFPPILLQSSLKVHFLLVACVCQCVCVL